MKHLSEPEFHATFTKEMHQVDPSEGRPFDFWPYFDAIPAEDFAGFDCSEGRIEWIWKDSNSRFEHVLVNSDEENVFMVLVLDLKSGLVRGHRILNLDKEYGLAH